MNHFFVGALLLLSCLLASAQPLRFSPGGTNPDTPGEDQQSNIGSIVTNPSTTSALTSQKNAPVIAPGAEDVGPRRGKGTVHQGPAVETPDRAPGGKLETEMEELDRERGGGGSPALPAHP